MTSHFNLSTFDSVYDISVLQNQLGQQQKFQQQHQEQRYLEANTFTNTTTPFLITNPHQQQQEEEEAAVTAATAQLAHVQHQIQPSYIYNPSPPLNSNVDPSLRLRV
jgi:hypothetical protein